tara:strand:- start:479 stop:604 length:126 start_codon:yes stop_codon:yes gene_type:complete
MICYICDKIFKEDEPSWYNEETENHTCDKCEEKELKGFIEL